MGLAWSVATLGCSGDDPEPRPRASAPEATEAAPEAPQELFSRSRPLMGTVFVIQVDAPEEKAAPAVRAAFDEIARLERVLSEWRPDSEISRINQRAGGAPVEVGEDTEAVVEAGLDVSKWSHGAFDLSWAALRGLYDFRPGHHRVPERGEVRTRLGLIDWEAVQLDDEAHTVRLAKDGMAIGTGGIGKGYALDRAGAVLRDAGIESYMLFGGGQVQVHGTKRGRPWRVGIQHPRRADQYFAFLETAGGSISTSGDYEHATVDADGTRWHHILDPRTGLPVARSVSVTLVAESGLYADALSTAAFVLGPQKALRMLEDVPVRAEAVIVGEDCRVHATPGTLEKLTWRIELRDGVLPGC